MEGRGGEMRGAENKMKSGNWGVGGGRGPTH